MMNDACCGNFKVMPVNNALLEDALSLELRLWPNHTREELREEMTSALQSAEAVIFVAYADTVPAGFAHCAIRHDYVEGTSGGAVGYLEGIFVDEPYWGMGCARALLSACEGWARRKGCAEFASDCEMSNTQSEAFHKRVGFRVANRIVCFVKEL